MRCELLENGYYSARELRLNLARIRQRPVPPRTFRHWKGELGISPDEFGRYTEKDFQKLRGLIAWIKAGGTIYQFREFHIRNQGNAN